MRVQICALSNFIVSSWACRDCLVCWHVCYVSLPVPMSAWCALCVDLLEDVVSFLLFTRLSRLMTSLDAGWTWTGTATRTCTAITCTTCAYKQDEHVMRDDMYCYCGCSCCSHPRTSRADVSAAAHHVGQQRVTTLADWRPHTDTHA